MQEAEYKRKLVAEINAMAGGYAYRIEDRFAVGRLDMLLKLPNRPLVLAEGKIVIANLFKPSPRQFVEGQRIMKAGIPALLIGWRKGDMYVSLWCEKADYRNCFTLPRATFASIVDEYLRTRV